MTPRGGASALWKTDVNHPQISHKPADFHREWQLWSLYNINVMVYLFTQHELPRGHIEQSLPFLSLHYCEDGKKPQKVIIHLKKKKNDNHNITSAVHMNFNESYHIKSIIRHLRFMCSCNLPISFSKVFFKTEALVKIATRYWDLFIYIKSVTQCRHMQTKHTHRVKDSGYQENTCQVGLQGR